MGIETCQIGFWNTESRNEFLQDVNIEIPNVLEL